MTSLLEASGIALGTRLAPLDFVSAGGELVALVGPNGGGKTSLLRALARVEDAAGDMLIDGAALDGLGEARRRRLVAFLPASREIAWPIAVRDVIAMGLGASDAARLARARAARPRLLLLDEPLSNLDPYWVLRTLELLRDAADGGATVMVALHDIGQVGKFDRLMLLEGGRVVGDGPPRALRERLGALFGVEATAGGWAISRG